MLTTRTRMPNSRESSLGHLEERNVAARDTLHHANATLTTVRRQDIHRVTLTPTGRA
jgi:hypothetical protein